MVNNKDITFVAIFIFWFFPIASVYIQLIYFFRIYSLSYSNAQPMYREHLYQMLNYCTAFSDLTEASENPLKTDFSIFKYPNLATVSHPLGHLCTV